MRLLQRLSKLSVALLLTFMVGSTAYGQVCNFYLNSTDGDDGNTGLASTQAWRSFEFAYNQAAATTGTFPKTICTAAGEYYHGDDADGVQLVGTQSMTFLVQTFGGNNELRFSADGPFTLDTNSGTTKRTITIEGQSTGATVAFGSGVQSGESTTEINFVDGILSTTLPVTIDDVVTEINYNTDAAVNAPTTFAGAARTYTIEGNVNRTSGGEIPNSLSSGFLDIRTSGGTYTLSGSHSIGNGGTVEMNGEGNATFSNTFTVNSNGTAVVRNNDSGTLAFSGGINVNATDNLSSVIENNADGAITASSTTFNHTVNVGSANVTAQIDNNGSGTVTTGLLSDVNSGTALNRVLVDTRNLSSGVMNVGGSTSVIGGNLENDGTFNLQGDVLLEGDLDNSGSLNTGTSTLQLLGGAGQSYSNAGGITGSGTVEILDDATIADEALPSVTVTKGDVTVTASTIKGNLNANSSGTVNVDTPSITGNANINAGDVTLVQATSVGGNLVVGGSGTLVNDFELSVTGNLDLQGTGPLTGGTFNLGADVNVIGNFLQEQGSTLDFGASVLNLRNNFVRTGGSVIPGTGTLRFIPEKTVTFQGGPNMQIWDVRFEGLSTNVQFVDGTIEVLNDLFIGSNAAMDLGVRLIRMLGNTSLFENSGSYNADPDGKVVFEGLTGSTQGIQGNGLFGNIEIRLENENDNVLLEDTPGLQVTLSGVLTFTRGGIDGQSTTSFNLSEVNQTPLIRRNMADVDAEDGEADGKFFTFVPQFNSAATPYDLEYFGAMINDTDTESEFTSTVRNVSVTTTAGGEVQLTDDQSFSGNLFVAEVSIFNLQGNTLTSTGDATEHLIEGTVLDFGGAETLVLAGTGSLDGSETGFIQRLEVDTEGAYTIFDLDAIESLDVLAGDVSLGLYNNTTPTPDDPGNINYYTQTGGVVALTSDIDINSTAPAKAVAIAGVFDISGGTFNNGDFDVYIEEGSSLWAAETGVFGEEGTGFFVMEDETSVNTDNDSDDDTNVVLVPRMRVDGDVYLDGNTGVSQILDHQDGYVYLDGETFTHAGSEWIYGEDAEGYGDSGDGTFHVNSESITLTSYQGEVYFSSLMVDTGDATFVIEKAATVTWTGNVTLLVTDLFTFNAGTVDQGVHDIRLGGPGDVFDYNAGTFVSESGELIFHYWFDDDSAVAKSEESLEQNFYNAGGLNVPFLVIENDVYSLDQTITTVNNAFTFGSDNSDLIFTADTDGNEGNIAFDHMVDIFRDGTGQILDDDFDPKLPIFPPEDGTWVNNHYLDDVLTSTELPGDGDNLGTLRFDPGSGHVILDKSVFVNNSLLIQSGNANTDVNDVTVTMGEDTSVERWNPGTFNVGTEGTNVAGGPVTLRYHTGDDVLTSQNGEFPGGDVVVTRLEVSGSDGFGLHADREVGSLWVDQSTTSPTTGPHGFNFNGHNLTVGGDADLDSGAFMDVHDPADDDLIIGGNLSTTDRDTFNQVDINVAGEATLAGEFVDGTLTVEGDATVGGLFAGNLFAGSDIIVTAPNGNLREDTQLSFTGFDQSLWLNNGDNTSGGIPYPAFTPNAGSETIHRLTLVQDLPGDGVLEPPMVKLMTDLDKPVTLALDDDPCCFGSESAEKGAEVDDLLRMKNGLFMTGDNILELPNSVLGFTRTVDEEAGEISHVVGNVGKPLKFGRSEYPVGSMSLYRVLAIEMNSSPVGTNGSLIIIKGVDEQPTGSEGLPIDGGAAGKINGTADFYWRASSSVSLGPASSFNFDAIGTGFERGVNYENVEDIRIIRRLDGDVRNTWQLQTGTYTNFETPGPSPDGQEPVVRVTGTTGGLVAQGSLFSFGTFEEAQGVARVQLIHNAANTLVSEVDVYVDDVLLLDNFAYREASALVDFDVASKGEGETATFEVALAPANSGSSDEAVVRANVDLTQDVAYIAVVLDSDAGVDIFLAEDVMTSANDGTAVAAWVLHGIADAPAVDVHLFDTASGLGPQLAEGLAFGESTGYLETEVDPANYTVELIVPGTGKSAAGTQVLASSADLSGLAGEAVGIIATGLVEPPPGREESRKMNIMVVTLSGETRQGAISTAVEEEVEIPEEFALNGNYPNPFNPSTNIQFDLPETAEVSILVIDMLGRQVMNLPTQTIEAGANRTVQVDAASIASGMYVYRLVAKSANSTWIQTGKMTLIK